MATGDDPTPEDPTPPRPRGAGWDDDEWVRRDLGPRPHVPDHGRRPFLVGLPILLITIAAVVAILVAGCGDDDGGDAAGGGEGPAAETAAGGSGPGGVAQLRSALARDASLLAGRLDPARLAGATCRAAGTGGEFSCEVDGAQAPLTFVLTGGQLGRKLAGAPADTSGLGAADVGALLEADDSALRQPIATYACATSSALNVDGTPAASGANGTRCVLTADGKPAGQRFVALGEGGVVTRDFLLPD